MWKASKDLTTGSEPKTVDEHSTKRRPSKLHRMLFKGGSVVWVRPKVGKASLWEQTLCRSLPFPLPLPTPL